MRNPFDQDEGSWSIEYQQLAIYNAERLRGILHSPQWIDYMASVQQRYNEEHGVLALVVHSDRTVS